MYLLALGLLLMVLKWQNVGPFEDLSWWWVVAPFAAAVLWWTWADLSGHNAKKAMARDEQRKLDRLNRQRKALGQRQIQRPRR